MNTRVKEVRQTSSVRLSQEEFGKRLGVSGAAISRIESGERALTEQMAISICREFGVNEHWLRTGEGDMFLPKESDAEFERIWTQIRVSDTENAAFIKRIMKSFWSLPVAEQTVIMKLIDSKLSEQ